MRVISTKEKPGNRKIITVELQGDEQLLSIRPNTFYRLGYPLDDVIASHILLEATPVVWCSVEQEWK